MGMFATGHALNDKAEISERSYSSAVNAAHVFNGLEKVLTIDRARRATEPTQRLPLVEKSMTQAKVKELLGAPGVDRIVKGTRFWVYCKAQDGVISFAMVGFTQDDTVVYTKFNEEKSNLPDCRAGINAGFDAIERQ